MSDDNATDCPICLCPVPSQPWGVCTPCGHPYHRECWDQVVAANHAASGGNGGNNRRRRKNPSCAICNGATRGFVPVFLDLGGGDGEAAEACAVAKGGCGDDGVIDLDEDEYEELVREWDCLWRELKTMCVYEENDGDTENGGPASGADGVVDMTRSDQYVAEICGAIDLTQHSPSPRRPTQPQRRGTQNDVSEVELFEQRRGRIQKILRRLKCLHGEILSSSQRRSALLLRASSSPSSNRRQIQGLRSKISDLQSANADLSSRNESLRAANDDLASKLEELQQTLVDRTIECERSESRRSALKSQFRSMEDSYKRHIAKSNVAEASLRERINKLQDEFKRLDNQAGLENAREMDEVRRSYGRMSQEVHDVRARNARLEEEAGKKEREWEARLGRERERRTALEERVEGLLSREGCGKGGGRGAFAVGGGLGEEEGGMEEESRSFERNDESKASSANIGAAAAYRKTVSFTKSSSGNVGMTTSDSSALSTKARMYEASWNAKPSAKRRAAAAPTRLQTAGSSTETGTGLVLKQRSSKAMEALDRASSRKLATQFKRKQQPLQSNDNACSSAEGENATDNALSDCAQLMMRTASRSSNKRRYHGSSSSSSGSNKSAQNNVENPGKKKGKEKCEQIRKAKTFESVSSKPRKINGVAAEVRPKGSISTFFKPIVNADV
mmetsp:Transcript_38138/g.81364  ORF Transcript_38138/g.81364 Transcript_38138/m.81364 type:complete len:675 (+) Transcript_38138:228-2252(+)|eukprot:CAMPEP_0172530508 /NCGR_PEP_ID=MMETSP1067-20121228/4222_1 /TAXON_ID=265564 ORGANISM="Thalassiosira punctigera, Strain Tpunct2005C2" /NCGR_SAMPLE_ID=MMETSP1067 /ASSEMBLY_ACC=CAM_ASM_000444 /LENGTH=674 /DNA_ID=CAMNT_0013314727 /DNA_START=225 /DNA_END=2249 /DNA_ORIENTATION=-